MPTSKIDQLPNRSLIIKFYDSNEGAFIFESFIEQDMGSGGAYEKYVKDYELLQNPSSSVLINVEEFEPDIQVVQFLENENFNKDFFTFYGFDIDESDKDDLLEEIFLSGIEDFTPPRQNRNLVYDFKFINERGDYEFPQNTGGSDAN